MHHEMPDFAGRNSKTSSCPRLSQVLLWATKHRRNCMKGCMVFAILAERLGATASGVTVKALFYLLFVIRYQTPDAPFWLVRPGSRHQLHHSSYRKWQGLRLTIATYRRSDIKLRKLIRYHRCSKVLLAALGSRQCQLRGLVRRGQSAEHMCRHVYSALWIKNDEKLFLRSTNPSSQNSSKFYHSSSVAGNSEGAAVLVAVDSRAGSDGVSCEIQI